MLDLLWLHQLASGGEEMNIILWMLRDLNMARLIQPQMFKVYGKHNRYENYVPGYRKGAKP